MATATDTVGLNFQPLATTFGARIIGVDLTAPLSEAACAEIRASLHRFRVLLFRGQQLTIEQIAAAGRTFGTLENHAAAPEMKRYLVPDHPDVLMLSNIFVDGEPIGYYNNDNEEWHADYSWTTGRMSVGSALYAAEAPAEGGATLFADATTAYADLPERLRARIDALRAVHSLTYLHERQHAATADKPAGPAEDAMPDVLQPLVRTHPVTGDRSLLLGTMEIRGIAELPDDDGRRLLDELTRHVAHPRYVYRHEWQVGDLVAWDNHAVLHAATYCDRHRFRRKLYRTTFVQPE